MVLSEVEPFVRDASLCKLQITESIFLHHFKALLKILKFISSVYKELINDIDSYYPVFHKGQWWRCPRGHYYCCPVSLLDGIKLKCPECGGTSLLMLSIISIATSISGSGHFKTTDIFVLNKEVSAIRRFKIMY